MKERKHWGKLPFWWERNPDDGDWFPGAWVLHWRTGRTSSTGTVHWGLDIVMATVFFPFFFWWLYSTWHRGLWHEMPWNPRGYRGLN